jgi:hypothetical protein
MKEKVILLIPLTFNDGSAVAPPILQAIMSELFAAYGGYTIAGEVRGAYRMHGGRKQIDTCLEVWVAIERDRKSIRALKDHVARFGELLGQETMYFERTGAIVEFIAGQRTPRRRS